MTQSREDFIPAQGEATPDVVDDATEMRVLRILVKDLQQEKATLAKGLQSRQRIGFITGVLAQRYGLQPDEAWGLLARISQNLNVKAHQVADVLLAVYTGQLPASDVKLAVRISTLLPQDPAAGTPDGPSSPQDSVG